VTKQQFEIVENEINKISEQWPLTEGRLEQLKNIIWVFGCQPKEEVV
jgi:hypothetical protein